MNYEEQQHHNLEQLEVEEQLLAQHSKRKRPLWRRVFRFLFRTMMVFLLLLGLLRFVISYPSVQNRLVNWTTDYFSEKLNTEVSISYVNFSFFDKFLIEDFLVKDLDKDTLLYSEKLQIDIGLFSILNKKTRVDDILLENAHFKMITPKGDHLSNIQFIFNTFFPPGPSQPPTPEKPFPWNLDLKKVTLKNVSYTNLDHYYGVLMGYQLDSGIFTFSKFDLKTKEIAIKDALIRGVEGFHRIDTLRLPVPANAEIPLDTFTKIEYVDTFPRTPLLLTVDRLRIRDGRFRFDNDRFSNSFGEDNIDYQHMVFENIQLDFRNVRLYKRDLTARIERLAANEHKGFQVDKLSGDLHVTGRKAEIDDLKIITPYSELGDYVAFKYKSKRDFQDFINKVKLDVNLVDSKVAFIDLLTIAPVLQSNPFFARNEEEVIEVSGTAKNVVNRLRAKDIDMRIGKGMRLKGDFSSNNITIPLEAFMNLKLESFYSNMNTIQLLFKDVKFPAQVMRLGNLSFKGRLDGFLLDFVAEGKLKTDLGMASSNLRMNLKKGKNYGSYSGKFALSDFDLGTWLEEKDLGIINFSSDIKGQGFALQDINTEIKANIQDIAYRGYKYQDLNIDGLFDKKLFDGNLAVKDDNIDLTFDGKVDLNDTLPEFDLVTNFNYINLKPLNLVDVDYELSGNLRLDFKGRDPNEITGIGTLKDFQLISHDTTYTLSFAEIRSGIDKNNFRFYDVQSELVDGFLKSNFDFIKVQDILLNYVAVHYPSFTDALELKTLIKGDSNYVYVPNNPEINEQYRLNFKIKNTKNWLTLVSNEIGTIKNLYLKSIFSSRMLHPEPFKRSKGEYTSFFNFDLKFPNIEFGNIKIGNSRFHIRGIGDSLNMTSNIAETFIGDSLDIPSVVVANQILDDELKFSVNGDRIGDIFKTLKFNGAIKAIGNKAFRINVDTSDIIIFNRAWTILKGNSLTIYQNRVVPENLTLTHLANNETISLLEHKQRGLKLDVKNVSLEWLKEFVDIPNMDFKGHLDAIVEIDDLFAAENFNAYTRVDSLTMNDYYLGKLESRIQFANVNSPIAINALIRDNKSRLGIQGSYTAPTVPYNFKNDHYLNFKIEARNYPLDIVEEFIGDFVSQTKGAFNADVILAGTPSDPELSGNVRIRQLGLMVDYLQTYYTIDAATIKITDKAFVMQGFDRKEPDGGITKGCIMRDTRGYQAFVSGEVAHDNLSDFNFDLDIETLKFTFLDTKKGDNELFYGTAIGDANMKIYGPLDQPNIEINATSHKGTEIVLPIVYASSASEVKFINFTNSSEKEGEKIKRKYNTPVGLNLELNLNVTPDANMRLIFDEQVGDEIQGTGNGNLRMVITRTGEFTMNGVYTIKQGEYLFTLREYGINKPFEVREGGTITWTGDPLAADLNLNAYYRNLKVRPYNLILEYLNDQTVEQVAKRSTKVDLQMNLKGDLFQPDISFDLDLPNVDNSIKAFVDNKIQILREEQSELNRQVFGLVLLGDFLPSNSGSDNFVGNTIINTFTEMLSNQLSLYVTDLVTEALGQNSVISNIDVDVNIRRDNGQVDIQDPNGTDIDFGLKNSLFDDRVTISGVVSYNDAVGQTTSDFEIEVALGKKGRLRLKGYNRNEYKVDDIRNNSGVGISWTREFDSFSELFSYLNEKNKEIQ